MIYMVSITPSHIHLRFLLLLYITPIIQRSINLYSPIPPVIKPPSSNCPWIFFICSIPNSLPASSSLFILHSSSPFFILWLLQVLFSRVDIYLYVLNKRLKCCVVEFRPYIAKNIEVHPCTIKARCKLVKYV